MPNSEWRRGQTLGRNATAVGLPSGHLRVLHGQQLAIIGVAVLIWVLFFIMAPRHLSLADIYVAFMSTTPFLRSWRSPSTLVIIGGEIDLSFPSIMALGMAAFRAFPLGRRVAGGRGAAGGWLSGRADQRVIVVKLGIRPLLSPSALSSFGAEP